MQCVFCRDEEELRKSLSELADPNPKSIKRISSCSNPFLDFSQDPSIATYKHGLLVRKMHADPDCKKSRCPVVLELGVVSMDHRQSSLLPRAAGELLQVRTARNPSESLVGSGLLATCPGHVGTKFFSHMGSELPAESGLAQHCHA